MTTTARQARIGATTHIKVFNMGIVCSEEGKSRTPAIDDTSKVWTRVKFTLQGRQFFASVLLPEQTPILGLTIRECLLESLEEGLRLREIQLDDKSWTGCMPAGPA